MKSTEWYKKELSDMTREELIQAATFYKKQEQSIREYWLQEPKAIRVGSQGYWILLDDYEIANLRSVIEAIGYTEPLAEEPGILRLLNNGDWVGQLAYKLPKVDHAPNNTPLHIRQVMNKKTFI